MYDECFCTLSFRIPWNTAADGSFSYLNHSGIWDPQNSSFSLLLKNWDIIKNLWPNQGYCVVPRNTSFFQTSRHEQMGIIKVLSHKHECQTKRFFSSWIFCFMQDEKKCMTSVKNSKVWVFWPSFPKWLSCFFIQHLGHMDLKYFVKYFMFLSRAHVNGNRRHSR